MKWYSALGAGILDASKFARFAARGKSELSVPCRGELFNIQYADDPTYSATARKTAELLLLVDTPGTAHPRGSSNPGQCHVNFAEGCHLYIAVT